MAAQAFTAAQDSSAFALSPDSSNRADSSNSFSNSFSNKFFLEQLCFSIDLAVSSLLLLMLLRNPQKVSRIGNSMQTVCIGGLRLEEFLGPFFLVTAGILVARGSMAFTALLKASRGFMAAPALHRTSRHFSRLHEASWHP